MTMQTAERTRLTIDIEPALLRDIKIEAIKRDESVREYVTRLILAARERETAEAK